MRNQLSKSLKSILKELNADLNVQIYQPINLK